MSSRHAAACALASVCLCLVVATSGRAEVKETLLMQEAVALATTKTLLIFDVDNTLIEPDQMVGSDQWFDYAMDKLVAQDKVTEDEAEARVEVIWNEVQRHTKVHAVESTTPALIAELQKRGVKTMALTARPVVISDVTLAQIKSIGVDFKRTRPAAADFVLAAKGDLKRPARYRSGVLFANGNDKGKLLVAFLKRVGLKPDAVIFIDDKKRNVDNVERALAAAGIPHVEWRYGAADGAVARLDGPTADIQYFYLKKILSDGDAGALAKALPESERARFQRLEPLSSAPTPLAKKP